MKTNTLSALLIVALALLVSSCGMTSYYASNVYGDGIYYRATPESRAQIIAANNAQLQAALQTPVYDDDYVASDADGNLWLISNNREGYFASKLHRFDSPVYTYPFWVGMAGAIVYDVFGRPYYWDSWRDPFWYNRPFYTSRWYWDDFYYWNRPWYDRHWHEHHYHPHHYDPGYHPGGREPRRSNVVYTPRHNDGAYRTAMVGGSHNRPGTITGSRSVTTSNRNSNYGTAQSRTTTYSGNRSSRISSSAVARKGQTSSSSSNNRRSYNSSTATRSSSSSYSGGSSHSGGSSYSSSHSSGSSSSSSSGGGGRRR